MAVVVKEDAKSRSFVTTADGTVFTTRWVIIGSENELEINAALLDLPTFADGLIRTSVGPAEPQGGGLWFASVVYGNGRGTANNEVPAGEIPEDGVPPSGGIGPDGNMPGSISFSTTGGTSHITQSLDTVARIKSTALGGGVAPDCRNAIGLKRDGVEGCDVITAKMEFRWQQKRRKVTFADMRTLMRITAKTNTAAWKSFLPGELLYLGAEGSPAERGSFMVTHAFAFNENLAAGSPDLVISKINGVVDIQLPAKRGWDYVWCAYKDTLTGNEIYPLPIAAYVERVYREANFADLGLGV